MKNPLDYEKYISKRNKKTFYKIYVNNYTIFYNINNNIMEIRRILCNRRNFKYFVREKNVKYTVKQGN